MDTNPETSDMVHLDMVNNTDLDTNTDNNTDSDTNTDNNMDSDTNLMDSTILPFMDINPTNTSPEDFLTSNYTNSNPYRCLDLPNTLSSEPLDLTLTSMNSETNTSSSWMFPATPETTSRPSFSETNS